MERIVKIGEKCEMKIGDSRLRKSRISILLLTLFLVILSLPVCAAGDAVIDWWRTGAVSVTLQADGMAVSDAEMTLYHVADAQSKDGNLAYSFTEALEGCELSEEELNQEESASYLAKYALDRQIPGISKVTDENGFVRFDSLALGLYLVMQTGSVEGFSDCTPFFAAVPYSESDGWIYEVNAAPKEDIVRLTDLTVKKVWNDDGKNRPESVKIQLSLGENVMDTVILSAENDWNYTWKDLRMSDDWKIAELDVPKGYTPVYENEGYEYTVTNTASLAQTGQLNWPVPVLAAVGMLLFACGWMLVYTKRDEEYDTHEE